MVPVIALHARIVFRGARPEAEEELVAECVANAFVAYCRLRELGKHSLIYAGVLARFAARQVKDHRKVGGRLNVRDVSSTYCQARKNIVLERLDQLDCETNEWQEVLVQDRRCGPFELVRTKLDFSAWLRSLPLKKRRVAKFLARNETTTAAAEKFGMSPGRVSQIRSELLASYRSFVGDVDPTVAENVAA
jgi:hypothetical protein